MTFVLQLAAAFVLANLALAVLFVVMVAGVSAAALLGDALSGRRRR